MATVPANTFPYGYRVDGNGVAGMGTMLTIAQLESKKTVYNLHPEFWRRYKALIQYALTRGVHLGVGTGWRVQPNPPPPGFAKPGNSNHEGFPADGTRGGAVAIDTVPAPSWPWMEDNVKAYGLRTFKYINNEPWHIQPVEIPASRSYRTQPWVLQVWPLPGGTKPPPSQPSPPSRLPSTDPLLQGVPMQPLVLKYGGSPTANWSGYVSRDGGWTRQAINGMHHARLLVALGAIDAKTGKPVTDPNWADVSHTNNSEELDEWLTPSRD